MTAISAPQQPWTRIEADSGVLLRRPTANDAAGVFAVHRDPAVYQYDPQETHPDRDHTAQFLGPMLAHWAEHGFGYWAVLVPRAVWAGGVPGTDRADGEPIQPGGVLGDCLCDTALLTARRGDGSCGPIRRSRRCGQPVTAVSR